MKITGNKIIEKGRGKNWKRVISQKPREEKCLMKVQQKNVLQEISGAW